MSALDLSEDSLRAESPGKLGSSGEALILLVDSDPSSAEFMARALTQSEMKVVISDRITGAGGAAMQLRSHPEIGVVVIDPQTVPGRDNLAELREAGLAEDVQVILVAEPVILGRYAQSARGEIADFLPKPVARRTLLRAVLEAQKRHLSDRDSRPKEC
jgi:DNA-binding NtrC family response regulator